MNRLMANELFSLLKYALSESRQAEPPHASRQTSAYIHEENLSSFFSGSNGQINTLGDDPQTYMRKAIYQKVLLLTMEQIMSHAKDASIPVAQLKGEVLAECYPEGVLRTSSDIDLFVPPEFTEKFELMMKSMGAQKKGDVDNTQIGVADYFFPNGVHVEAHHIIGLQWNEDQRKFMRAAGMFSHESFSICHRSDTQIPTLDPTFHLVYLIYHFIKHLMFWEKSTVRMLVDINLFARSHEDEIDAARFKKLIEGLGYTRIADAIFEIGSKLLGIDNKVWVPAQTGLSHKMIRMIPARIGRYQSFRERLAWSTYHVCFNGKAGDQMDTKLVFRPVIFAAFLPFSIHWAWRRAAWHLETDYKSRAWRF